MQRASILPVALWVLLLKSGWALVGPYGAESRGITGSIASGQSAPISLVWRGDAEFMSGRGRPVEIRVVVSAYDRSSTPQCANSTEQISHMDIDWQSNPTCFLLSPEEFAATRFSPSQQMKPFHIRSVAFVPERATGSDPVLFFVAVDQAGYPGQHVLAGSIPVGIVNQFSGGFLQIAFAETTYFSGDFHFGVGTASAAGDSLSVYADTGGGDATHSLIYVDGTWYTMPDLGHSNSWIMQANIEYQVDVGERPVEELLQAKVYPNPFRATVTICYDLNRESAVEAVVFDIAGRQMCKLHSGTQQPGSHALSWDGTTGQGMRAAPGIYVCLIRAGSLERAHMMVLSG